MVLIVRSRQLRRRPERGFANGMTDIVRQRTRRPVAERRNARERHRVIGIGARADTTFLEEDIIGRYYLEKGSVESSFKYDHELKKASEVLLNQAQYGKLLKP